LEEEPRTQNIRSYDPFFGKKQFKVGCGVEVGTLSWLIHHFLVDLAPEGGRDSHMILIGHFWKKTQHMALRNTLFDVLREGGGDSHRPVQIVVFFGGRGGTWRMGLEL